MKKWLINSPGHPSTSRVMDVSRWIVASGDNGLVAGSCPAGVLHSWKALHAWQIE